MTRSLKSLENGLTARLAALLLCFGVFVSLSGCVVPQQDQEFKRIPDERNLPLRILPTSFKPEQRETTVRVGMFNDTDCRRDAADFIVQVDDDDDTTVDLWFIDPNVTYTETPTTPVFRGLGARGAVGIRSIKAPSALVNWLGGLTDQQRHRVEVMVTDGEDFGEDANGTPVAVTRRTAIDELGKSHPQTAYIDTFQWLVRVEECPR